MPRPGFVLEVDERTPPLLVHEGEGYRMQKFPLGTRVIYPPDSLPGIDDVNAQIRHALLQPDRRLEAAARAAARRHEAHDRVRRHLDPAAADGHARHPPADPRARDRAGRPAPASTTSRSDRRDRAAPPDDRGRDPADGRRARLPLVLARRPLYNLDAEDTANMTRRRADRPRRGRRDPEARRRVRPDRLRQHQPRRDGRRPQVGGGRARRLQEPQAPPQRQDDAALEVVHGPARGPQRDQRLRRPDGPAARATTASRSSRSRRR